MIEAQYVVLYEKSAVIRKSTGCRLLDPNSRCLEEFTQLRTPALLCLPRIMLNSHLKRDLGWSLFVVRR